MSSRHKMVYAKTPNPLIDLRDELKELTKVVNFHTPEIEFGWHEALNFVITTINTQLKETDGRT